MSTAAAEKPSAKTRKSAKKAAVQHAEIIPGGFSGESQDQEQPQPKRQALPPNPPNSGPVSQSEGDGGGDSEGGNGNTDSGEVKDKDGGYSGPLPIHEGRPVFIERGSAWPFYMTPQAKGHERVRNYLMIQDAFDLAEAMGRPLTIEDLKTLVGPNGVEYECSITNKAFQPMWWVVVTDSLIAALKEGKTLEELDKNDELVIAGQFFFRNGKILAYSGTPYRWVKGSQEDTLAWHSPVTMAYKANGRRWPMTHEAAEKLREAKREKKDRLVSMEGEIARQIGATWQPGSNGNGAKKHRHPNRHRGNN
jgi:hypothetical protein